MQTQYTSPNKPSKARVKAVQERYRRAADELLAVTSALEAHGIFNTPMTAEYDLVCEARDRARGERRRP